MDFVSSVTKMSSPDTLSSGGKLPLIQSAEDLCQPRIREAISHSFSKFLEQKLLSVTELLHSPDALTALDNADLALQGGLQRMAVRYAPEDQAKAYLDKYDALIRQRLKQLLADQKNDIFPKFTTDNCGRLAAELSPNPRGPYILRGAIAYHLRNCQNTNGKLIALSTMLESLRTTDPGWNLLHKAVDDIVTDLLCLPAFLSDLLTERKDLGNLLLGYIKLFLGHPVECRYGRGQGLDRLAWHYAAGDMPQSHTALGVRIRNGLDSSEALCDGPLRKEMLYFRQLRDLIERCIGPHMQRKDIIPKLQARSSRLGHPDQIRGTLEKIRNPDQKLTQLFFMESCLCDNRSRYKMADMIFRIMSADSYNQCFDNTQKPLTERLHKLTEFSYSARHSHFDEDQRQKMIDQFDIKAVELATKANLFESIDKRYDNVAEKAFLISRQFRDENITEKRLGRAARKRIMYYLASPGFFSDYLQLKEKETGQAPTREEALSDIRNMLKQAGIIPDIVLYRMVL